jgi:hypothetical protein
MQGIQMRISSYGYYTIFFFYFSASLSGRLYLYYKYIDLVNIKQYTDYSNKIIAFIIYGDK